MFHVKHLFVGNVSGGGASVCDAVLDANLVGRVQYPPPFFFCGSGCFCRIRYVLAICALFEDGGEGEDVKRGADSDRRRAAPNVSRETFVLVRCGRVAPPAPHVPPSTASPAARAVCLVSADVVLVTHSFPNML